MGHRFIFNRPAAIAVLIFDQDIKRVSLPICRRSKIHSQPSIPISTHPNKVNSIQTKEWDSFCQKTDATLNA